MVTVRGEEYGTIINVQAYGAKGDGVTDDTAAVVAAWAAAAAADYPIIYFPAGQYKVASSSGALLRLVEGMTVKGDGLDASEIWWVDTNPGSTISLINGPTSGNISGATIKDISLRGNHDSDSVAASSYPILIQPATIDDLKIYNVRVHYSRVFGMAIRGCFSVDIDHCVVQYCARDGINTADCDFVRICDNRIEFCDDDAIAGHCQTYGVADRGYVVTGNIIRFCQGIKILGAKSTTITGNTLEFCMGQGISVNTSALAAQTTEGATARHALVISGNVIKNCFDRANVDNLNQSAPYISISCSAGRAGSLAAVPGENDSVGGSVVDPYPYFWTAKDGSTTDPIAHSHHCLIVGNMLARDMYATTNLSDYELGIFYTRTGSIDPEVVEAAWLETGINFSGTGHIVDTLLAKNDFAGLGPALTLGDSVTVDDCKVDGNSIFDCTTGISISGSNTNHHNIEFINNTFNLDPYLKHANRGTTGTWQADSSPTALLIQSANGITLGPNNTFKNLCRVSDYSTSSVSVLTGTHIHVNGVNFIECEPAATGFSTSNKGIGNIPTGRTFILKAIKSDPATATFKNTLNGCPFAADAVPGTGTFIAGHFVWNTAVTGTPNILLGWRRMTTGTGHVDGTDWAKVYALSDAGSVTTVTTNLRGSSFGTYVNNSATGATCTIEQAGSGDASLQFLLTSATAWVVGVDNSDSNKFKIADANNGFTAPALQIDGSEYVTLFGGLALPSTITTPGTTGNQTINKPSGRVNIATAGTTVTVTNNLVTANSIILAEAATADTTARVTNVVPGAGSFVINTVATTAETAFNFLVIG